MDLGLAFDDEDLQSNTKDKTGDLHLPYNVKICTPEWFESAYAETSETTTNHKETAKSMYDANNLEDLQRMIKFDADFQYRQRNYSAAAPRYEKLLEILSPSNVCTCQDVKESLTRCYAYLGLNDKSLALAHEIVEEFAMLDESRRRQSLILLSFVSGKFERWKDCIDSLEKLCQLQQFFPQTFYKLGDMYQTFQASTTSSCISPEMSNLYPVLQLTCYLRARNLLQAVLSTSSQFVKDRNDAMILELSQKIERISIPDSDKIFAEKYIKKEIENFNFGNKDEMSPVAQDNESTNDKQSYQGLFYYKFCSWHVNVNNNKR